MWGRWEQEHKIVVCEWISSWVGLLFCDVRPIRQWVSAANYESRGCGNTCVRPGESSFYIKKMGSSWNLMKFLITDELMNQNVWKVETHKWLSESLTPPPCIQVEEISLLVTWWKISVILEICLGLWNSFVQNGFSHAAPVNRFRAVKNC